MALELVTGHYGPISVHYFIPQMTGQELLEAIEKEDSESPIKLLWPKKLTLAYPHHVPILEIVVESRTSYFAGVSYWKSLPFVPPVKSLNRQIIGIQLHTPGYGLKDGFFNVTTGLEQVNDWYHFTPITLEQKKALAYLLKDIEGRYPQIETRHVLTQAEVAPVRAGGIGKTAPGPHLGFDLLHKEGLAESIEQEELNAPFIPSLEPICEISDKDACFTAFKQILEDVGFKQEDVSSQFDIVLNAFVMHHFPSLWKGPYQEVKEHWNTPLLDLETQEEILSLFTKTKSYLTKRQIKISSTKDEL
jgi:N-acetyl-anhydromuramyl-L-alanine amidase AmpD